MTSLPEVGVAGAVPVVWEVPLAWDPVSESSPSSPSLLSVLSPVGAFLLKSWRVRLDRGWFSWSRPLFTVNWIFSYTKSKLNCFFFIYEKSYVFCSLIIREVYNYGLYHIIIENRLLAYFTTFNLNDFAPRHFKLCTILTIHEVFNLLEMACIYIYNVIWVKTQNLQSNLYTAFMEISFDCPTYRFDTYTSRPLLDLPLTFCRRLCPWRLPGFLVLWRGAGSAACPPPW